MAARPAPVSKPIAYRALTGISYGDQRIEAGQVVDDLPANSVEWLLDQGHIETVTEVSD